MPNKPQTSGGGARASDKDNADSRRGGIKRVCATLVVLLTILWLTAFFAVRTPVGQDAVRERVEAQLGMDCDLERATLRFPLIIRIRDLHVREKGAERICIRVPRLDFGWGGGASLRGELLAPEIILQQNDAGDWGPGPLARLGGALDGGVNGVASLAQTIGTRFRVEVREGIVRWLDSQGERRDEVNELSFHSQPVRLADRVLQYCELAYRRPGSGQNAYAWFSTEDVDFVEMPLPVTSGTRH